MAKAKFSRSRSRKRDCRKRDWPRINGNLRGRGNVTVWVDAEMIPQLRKAPEKTSKPGRPARYPDLLITVAHAVKAVYGLRLRQAEGFLRSIFRLMGLSITVPDYTTLSRRMPNLDIPMPHRVKPDEAIHMVIDSTGCSKCTEPANGTCTNTACASVGGIASFIS